jgi:glycosyltransferase involved in cell wall biosynthesis
MKIGIDARIWKTGIGRYTQNLIYELTKIADPDDEFVIFLRKDGFDEFVAPNKRFTKVLADFPSYSFAEQLILPLLLLREKVDLMHFTNFNLPVLWPRKFILTIHDLIHLSHSTFGSSTRNYLYYLVKKLVYRIAIWWVAQRASKILVPSEATQIDLIKYLGVSSKKVVVTYEGGTDHDVTTQNREKHHDDKAILQQYGVTKPFILYVATMYPHKNHEKLVEAFRLLTSEILDIQLVLIGKVDYFSEKMVEKVSRWGLSDKVLIPGFKYPNGYMPDQDLFIFYRNALVYVFPSLKEGFGIPVLEAQAFGLPVVASGTSCLPEIGGDSVVYFDPNNAVDIKNKILEVTRNEKLRNGLINRGYENLRRFSWQKMAEETQRVYHQAK